MATEITLRTQDGETFKVERRIAVASVTIRDIVSDVDDLTVPIELPAVSSEILRKILEFVNYHDKTPVVMATHPRSECMIETQSEWDAAYCDVPMDTLEALIAAANFLDIRPLVYVLCRSVADMIKGRTPEEIRETFGIENDFSPEELAQVRLENAWADERA